MHGWLSTTRHKSFLVAQGQLADLPSHVEFTRARPLGRVYVQDSAPECVALQPLRSVSIVWAHLVCASELQLQSAGHNSMVHTK